MNILWMEEILHQLGTIMYLWSTVNNMGLWWDYNGKTHLPTGAGFLPSTVGVAINEGFYIIWQHVDTINIHKWSLAKFGNPHLWISQLPNRGFHSHGKYPIRMDDLGVPHLWKPPKCANIRFFFSWFRQKWNRIHFFEDICHEMRRTQHLSRWPCADWKTFVCLPTEARACYRVPIGAARASYGVWVKAHKAVTHSDWPVELTVELMKKERSLGYAKIDVEKPLFPIEHDLQRVFSWFFPCFSTSM